MLADILNRAAVMPLPYPREICCSYCATHLQPTTRKADAEMYRYEPYKETSKDVGERQQPASFVKKAVGFVLEC